MIIPAALLILSATCFWIRHKIRSDRWMTQLERRRFDAWCDEHEVRL